MQKNKFIFFFLSLLIFVSAQNKTTDSLAKAEAKTQIEKYRMRVIKGEKMEALARQYSEDPGSSMKGGLYMDVGRGVMDPEFEKVAFSLKQGQISKVFETAYGFHFIQLERRRGKLLDLRHILIIPKVKK